MIRGDRKAGCTCRLDLPIVESLIRASCYVREAGRLYAYPENRHPGFVTFRLALRWLLPLLAVVSLALTQVTASAVAAGVPASMTAQAQGSREGMPVMGHDDMGGVEMAGMGMDDMPCCPSEKPLNRDCANSACPLMALCIASLASLPPSAIAISAPSATRLAPAWPDAASFGSLHGPPLPEPPRA